MSDRCQAHKARACKTCAESAAADELCRETQAMEAGGVIDAETLAEWKRLNDAGFCLCSSADTAWDRVTALLSLVESQRAEVARLNALHDEACEEVSEYAEKAEKNYNALAESKRRASDLDLEAIAARYSLARMAGEAADDAGQGWDNSKIRAVVRSWQDVYDLYRYAKESR